MNKWLCIHWYWLYFQFCAIRVTFYILIGQKEKAKRIINEHRDWTNIK